MTFRAMMLAVLLVAAAAPAASAQVTQVDGGTPSLKVLVIVRPSITDFNALVARYFAMRTGLESELPVRHVTDKPAENLSAEYALARRIRAARDDARRGDIFTPAISAEFRMILRDVMEPRTLEAIMDDNPGAFWHGINATYPKRHTLSTMPGTILRALPGLPDGVEYRFLGNDLILHDTHANVILDRLPCAIACVEVVD